MVRRSCNFGWVGRGWVSCLQLFLLILISSARIGEAANPGPQSSEAVFLGACNPTGFNGKQELAASLPAHSLFATSETHLTSEGVHKFRKGLKLCGSAFAFLPGYPAPLRPRSKVVGSHTGVGFLTDFPVRGAPQQWPDEIWQTSRVQVASAFVHSLFLLAAVIYGFPTSPANTAVLLDAVTQRVVLEGVGPRVIAGDFNLEADQNPCLQTWSDHGFIEVQDLHQRIGGHGPLATCKGVTRKDFVYVSPELQGFFRQAHVMCDIFPDHAVLAGEFRFPTTPPPCLLWRSPVHRPREQLQDLQVPQGCAPALDGLSQSQKLLAICSKYETRLSQALQHKSRQPLTSSKRGRAATTCLHAARQQPVPVRKARQGDVDPFFFGNSSKHVRWVKQARRLQALVQNVRRGLSTPGPVAQRASLWRAVLLAPGFEPGFAQWWPDRDVRLLGDPTTVPRVLPCIAVLEAIATTFLANLRGFEQTALRSRCREAAKRRSQQPALIFRDIAAPPVAPVSTLVESKTATVLEVRPEEAAVVLDRVVDWDDAPFFASGRSFQPHQCDEDMLWGELPALAVGDVITQTRILGSVQDIFAAFGREWQARWCRHDSLRPEDWQCSMDGLLRLSAGRTMELEPISVQLWRDTVRSKPAGSATGLDGLSRMDLCLMPADLLECILDLCRHAEQHGEWPQQPLVGVVSALEKKANAAAVGDFRPITVLGTIYRTWSSIRSRQVLRYLSSFAPPTLHGNMPGQTAAYLWYSMQIGFEESRYSGVPVHGFVADLVKAYNLLPRVPVLAAAKAAWNGALVTMERRFRVRGCLGPALRSSTGFAEGCGMSCVAMALVDCALHCHVTAQVPRASTSTYVDNWAATAPDVPTLLQTHAAFLSFTQAWDICMDVSKTQSWSPCAVSRRALRREGMPVILDGRDLGGHACYSSRHTNFTLTKRLDALAPLWPRLRASPSPACQKKAALATAAWPKGLHGVAAVSLGGQHFTRMRAGALHGLGWDRPGTSPLALLSLAAYPTCDPEFFAIRDTVWFVRVFSSRETMAVTLEEALSMPGRRFPGPAGVLLERVALLGWSWNESICEFQDSFGGLCLWRVSPQELEFRMVYEWQRHVAGKVACRKGFDGLAQADFALTRDLLKAHSGAEVALLEVALTGTFFTEDALCHFEEGGRPVCRFCGQPASIEHRIWQCSALDRARHQALVPGFPGTGTLRDCQRLHGWAMQPEEQLTLWRALHQVPDTSEECISVPVGERLDLFVDGSCAWPVSRHLQLASWAVVVARHFPGEQVRILNAGCLPGIMQTSLRAEIFALYVACKFCRGVGARARVWCDCLGVVRKANMLLGGHWRVKPNTKNCDLWRLVAEELSELAGRVEVHQVRAHTTVGEETDVVQEWVQMNNQDVDHAAKQANWLRPHSFWDLWRAVQRDLAYQQFVGGAVLRVHAAIGLAASRREEKLPVADAGSFHPLPEQAIQLGAVDVRRQTTFARRYGGRVLSALELWAQDLFQASDPAVPLRWVSVFQLMCSYTLSVGRRPPFFDEAAQLWYEPDTRIHGGLLSVHAAKLTHWFGRLLKAYVESTGGRYMSMDLRPDSTVLQVKLRCVAVPWPAPIASMVEAFLSSRLPGSVCGGRSRSWAHLRF